MADTNPGDLQGDKLKAYWVSGEGAAKIRWNSPHDYDRCVIQLSKHIPVEFAHRLCNVYHRAATGAAPGQEDRKR